MSPLSQQARWWHLPCALYSLHPPAKAFIVAVLQRSFIDEEAAPSSRSADPAQLAILRLTHDEMSFRAVAVAGNWANVSAAAIQQAPMVRQEYPFSIFKTQGQQEWVMMPAWSAVMAAAEPVALVIDDCAKLDVLLQQTKVRALCAVNHACVPSLLLYAS